MVVAAGLTTSAPALAAPGDTEARANAYDDAWQEGPDGWVEHCREIVSGGTQVEGMVLWIGDSLTRGHGLGAWAQGGAGKTAEDAAITTWMHAGLSPQSIESIDGFALATPYVCSNRSYTVGDGLGAWDFLGSGMPAETDPVAARSVLEDCGSYPNAINLTTMLAALPPAQFAIPEVNLFAADPSDISVFEAMVAMLIENHIVPVIITYTYRGDAAFNLLVDEYNVALTELARSQRLPLIDLNAEMLARVPFEQWPGRYLSDGVHYTNGGGGYEADADPYQDGGDPESHTTGAPLTYNGYGLKGWLGVQKMKEIKRHVIDAESGPGAVAPPAAPYDLRVE